MRKTHIILVRKLRILAHTEFTGNLEYIALKFNVQASQIRLWLAMKVHIESAVEKRPTKMTLHEAYDVEHGELESNFIGERIFTVRIRDMCVTTNDIICKDVSLLLSFKQNDEKKLKTWVYAFMQCHNLTVRNATCAAQKKCKSRKSEKGSSEKRYDHILL